MRAPGWPVMRGGCVVETDAGTHQQKCIMRLANLSSSFQIREPSSLLEPLATFVAGTPSSASVVPFHIHHHCSSSGASSTLLGTPMILASRVVAS